MNRETEDMDYLKDACAKLAEHFDTVQIFVTRVSDEPEDDNGTVNAQKGAGNWFARMGQVRHWVDAEDERMREAVRKEE